ncbi:peroxidase family protein [Bremerella sp. P1]|uniref:peroxidase family protein n=1 Tax=Bremerella sp. P1 TaxID=3026424 RepID=UPI002367B760|nr:peroxidase family protein [Bremerella sp. P1]WDI44988.1 peroxidase family protein [Bremerella sp. P1]
MRNFKRVNRIARNKRIGGEQLEQRQLLASDLSVVIDSVLDEVRTIDGTGNNLIDPSLGSTDTAFIRIVASDYADGISEAAGEDRPSAREVSNNVVAQSTSVINDRFLTDFVWQWGQFLDHDIDLTGEADPHESLPIEVPTGDIYFDPTGTGTATISLSRSDYDPTTGTAIDNPREQINSITAFIDGSMIYGSDDSLAAALRTFEGGRLKTSEGNLLPYEGDVYEDSEGSIFFVAGDVRANEQVGLTAMHTLFVREHNRLADEIAAANPDLTDEEIYQQARAIVIAEIQAITYNEFLPALLGPDAIAPYQGYDPTVDPSIANEFATAAYRFGHSMLSGEVLRLNNDGTVAEEGSLSLREMFFNPREITDNGIDSLLLGLASQQAQEIDSMLVDDVRNFLFGPPGAGGFDLASLNIQRGRDHGLADYNTTRVAYGLDPVTSFDEISSNPDVVAALQATYDSVDDIDLWVGGLAEDHVPGASMGELFRTILVDQFTRLRDGDRFWYQNVFTGRQLEAIEQTSLSEIITRNTDITSLQENVFFDASVWIHDASENRSEVTWVTGTGDEVTIQETDRNGTTAETNVTTDVGQVQVVGEDLQRDVFVLDLSQLDSTMDGGFVVQGQEGRGDVLVLVTGDGVDSIVIGEDTIEWNNQLIAYSGIERIVIFSSDPSDSVEVEAGIDVRVDTLSEEVPTTNRELLEVLDRPAQPRRGEEPRRGDDDRRREEDARRREDDFRRAVDRIVADFA